MKQHKAITKKKGDKMLSELYEAFSAIKTKTEAQQFLQDLCSPAEIEAMADRWYAIDLIKNKKSYRQIYNETGISVTTVGRVARCLRADNSGYQLIYERVKKHHPKNKILKTSKK